MEMVVIVVSILSLRRCTRLSRRQAPPRFGRAHSSNCAHLKASLCAQNVLMTVDIDVGGKLMSDVE